MPLSYIAKSVKENEPLKLLEIGAGHIRTDTHTHNKYQLVLFCPDAMLGVKCLHMNTIYK